VTACRARRGGQSATAVRVCAALLATFASGCTSLHSVYAPTRTARIPVHVVQRGETLYKIAWQYRVDQRDLVRWNGLRDPDVLYVGQRLWLAPPRGAAAARSRERPTAGAAPSSSRVATTSAPARPASLPPPQWRWPADGAVVTAFGAPNGIATGIAIRGREGQPVRAAAAGRVVYAGGGLIGYGQLVIIKHNDTYLSAYGHNSRLLVSQGQAVKSGETIALMGLGPERQARLHFEIRRDGEPVDPLPLLPPRP
jgi:lipoprotein NlpD